MANGEPPVPAAAAHPMYHEVRNAELELQVYQQTLLEQMKAEFEERFNAEFTKRMAPLIEQRALVFKAAGLDPAKAYEFNPVLQTIVETKG